MSMSEEVRLCVSRSSRLAYPRDALVHEAFMYGAADGPALVGDEEEITYAELRRWARAIAHTILTGSSPTVSCQAGPTASSPAASSPSFASCKLVIGVLVPVSPAAVAAVYGVLTAGAAYLALDPSAGNARHLTMLEIADANCLLLGASLRPPLGFNGAVLPLPQLGEVRERAPLIAPRRTPSDAAYVCFTSGTSGRPKGVVVPHGPLVARIHWMEEAFGGGGEKCCVLLKTPFVFGVSEWELFWPLSFGHSARIATSKLALACVSFKEAGIIMSQLSLEDRVTHAFFVSSVLREVLLEVPKGSGLRLARSRLRLVVQCGERLDARLCVAFHATFPTARLANLYGPTEASMTLWRVPRSIEERDVVLVGEPIANAFCVLLRQDEDGEPQPVREVGEVGELCFGGILARGYLGKGGQFIDGPAWLPASLPAVLGDRRLYRTGDLAVRRPDGLLELRGRSDRQVKVNGIRLELAELESMLRAAGAKEAAIVQPPPPFAGTLVAFLVLQDDVDVADFASRALAVAAVRPGLTLRIDTMPRLASGKPDLRALAEKATETLLQNRRELEHYDEQPLSGSLGEFLGSTYAAKLSAAGHDSLGLAREWRRSADEQGFLQVTDAMRAWATFGVIVDHWNMNGWAPVLANYNNSGHFGWQNLVLRSVGNAQSLFLFVVADAADDARMRKHEVPLGRPEVVLFVVYLAMRWPLPRLLCAPLYAGVCPACFVWPYAGVLRAMEPGSDHRDWDVVAVHRWYLYFGLSARLLVRATCSLSATAFLPALAAALTALSLVAPYSLYLRCNLTLSSWAPVRLFGKYALWGGVYAWPGLFSMLSLYTATYALLFFFFSSSRSRRRRHPASSQTTTAALEGLLVRIRTGPKGQQSWARSGFLFGLYLLLCCLLTHRRPTATAVFFASFKQNWGASTEFMKAYAAEVASNLSLVGLFAVAASAMPRRPRVVTLAASTTLGCYVTHPYVLGDLRAYLRLLGACGPTTQLVVALGLPAMFQVLCGPIAHRALLAPIHASLRCYDWAAARVVRARSDDGDGTQKTTRPDDDRAEEKSQARRRRRRP